MYNRAILIGWLGRDAEVRYMEGGDRGVINFTLATSRSWRDRDGNWQSDTQWHNISHWGSRGLDNLASKLKKGTLAMVEGEIRKRQWEDRNGQTREIIEIRAYKIVPLGKREKDESSMNINQDEEEEMEENIPSSNDNELPKDTEDDLPF
ncbi:single-stranded DNA-binding protein [bacterium]|nr:MAG: single-stranded DNA-binding protein [bacterium]